MYKLLLIKRMLEGIFIFPFILLGRLVALLNPMQKEYRIFFFFPFYHTGGAEKVHAQVAAATGSNDSIIFFTRKSADDRFHEDFRNTGCEIRDISKYTDNKWLYFLNLIYRGIITGYINSQNQKPVVFNGQCNFGYKISPWVKRSIAQVELIHSLNSFSYIRIPFIPFISKTVMISQKRILDHKALYQLYNIPEDLLARIIYIPNAIQLPVALRDKTSHDLTVLYVGRGTKEKRIELVAAIAKELSGSGVRFEIMGDVSEAINSADYPFIVFHGNVSDEKRINEIYQKAHILLLTSSTEGFPMVIMEAMAHGSCIISTAVGDIPFHVKNGENGFLLSDAGSESYIIKEAVENILWLKNNRDALNKMAVMNYNYAKHNFGIERFNNDYRNLVLTLKEKN
jgi:L-malate glycosyltransferase